ncbi:MAG: chorismate synthase, partial [Rhodocyclaceae bacterium]|nr:chorismate synthase [Rhodocyclaceae bacterium]
AGFASVADKGSTHGDSLTPQGFVGNKAGGVLGGISTGQDIVVHVAVKPTSSIRLPRRSIDRSGAPVIVETTGRHDPCVGIRATPICESMLALTLIDHALRHRAQNADVVVSTPRIAALAPSADSAAPAAAATREDSDPSEA